MSAASLELMLNAHRRQADYCRGLDRPFTASVIDALGEEIARGGVFSNVLSDYGGETDPALVPLRLAAAMHWLALSGRSPTLRSIYRQAGESVDFSALSEAISTVAGEHPEIVADFAARAPQTNEANRAAALIVGFAKVAEKTGLPLDLFEIGASGGALLVFDRFRYRLGDISWGAAGGPPVGAAWSGPCFSPPCKLVVAGRRGCDLHPVDYRDPAARLRARSYVWPEDKERLDRFDRVTEIVARGNIVVERASADEWINRMMPLRRDGAAAVVYHSIVEPYLTSEQKGALREAIEAAGHNATARAPLAWLRFEPFGAIDGEDYRVDLTVWPGGKRRVLAKAHPHALWVSANAPDTVRSRIAERCKDV